MTARITSSTVTHGVVVGPLRCRDWADAERKVAAAARAYAKLPRTGRRGVPDSVLLEGCEITAERSADSSAALPFRVYATVYLGAPPSAGRVSGALHVSGDPFSEDGL